MSLVVAVVLAILQSQKVGVIQIYANVELKVGRVYKAKVGILNMVVCPVAFVLTLLFWQQLRALLRLRSRRVFMDKMCIHQTDKEKKAQGILSLGGFLDSSQRFVILWSPRYFSRLWCVFEVAMWSLLGRVSPGSVRFVPVGMAAGTVVGTLSVYVVFAIVYFAGNSKSGLLFAAMIVFPMPVYAMQRVARDLDLAHEQLSGFSVKKAECFCCSLPNHWHGPSGTEIPCDRKLVQQTLRRWFTDAGKDLDKFDDYVQTNLGLHVWEQTTASRSRYFQGLLVGTPLWWEAAGLVDLVASMETFDAVRYVVERVALIFGIIPCLMEILLLLARFSRRCSKRYAKSGGLLLEVATAVTYYMLAILACFGVQGVGYVGRTLRDPVPALAILAVGLVAAPLFFFGGCKRRPRHPGIRLTLPGQDAKCEEEAPQVRLTQAAALRAPT